VIKYWRIALAMFGSVVLVLMVRAIGPAVLIDAMRQAGWIIVPILLVQFAVYALNAAAWRTTMRPDKTRPGYLSVLRISVTGFAMNFITPVVNAGGEPYRIAALAPWTGTARATGSVLLYVLIHAVSSILFWLSAIVATFLVLPLDRTLTIALIGTAVVLCGVLAAVMSGHRDGVVQRVAKLLYKLRLRKLSKWLADRHHGFEVVDAEITRSWRENPARLAAAIGLDLVARYVGVLELILIAAAMGIPMTPLTAIVIAGFHAFAMNLFFFFPWEIGSREGTTYALSKAVGLPIEFAGLAAVLGRVREITWTGIGMALLWMEGSRPSEFRELPVAGSLAPESPEDQGAA
jgi:uncharacterized protein (TIRG00374 family)